MEEFNPKLLQNLASKGIYVPRPQTSSNAIQDKVGFKKETLNTVALERPKSKSKEDPFRVRPITPSQAFIKKPKNLLEDILKENIDEGEICRILNIDESELVDVQKIELKLDLKYSSLQEMGDLLPNLLELKLSNSRISSLRDIGTSCRNLRTLWVSSCGIRSCSGISGFPILKEFFASYNEIIDVSDLAFHEGIEILDLEGNDISDIDPLSLVPNLKELTLAGNPISENFHYQEIVSSAIPELSCLDEGIDFDLHNDKDNYKIMKSIIRKGYENTKETEVNSRRKIEHEDNGHSEVLFDNENAFCANACKLLKGKKKGAFQQEIKDFTREEITIEEEKYFMEYFQKEFLLQKSKEDESKGMIFDEDGEFEIYEIDDELDEIEIREKLENLQRIEKREISTANTELRVSKVRRPSLNASSIENSSRILNDESSEINALDLQNSQILQEKDNPTLGKLKGIPISRLAKFQAISKLTKNPLSNSGFVGHSHVIDSTTLEEGNKKFLLAKRISDKGGLRQMKIIKNIPNPLGVPLNQNSEKPVEKSNIKKFMKIRSDQNAAKGLFPILPGKQHLNDEANNHGLNSGISIKKFSLKKPFIKKPETETNEI